MIARDMDKKTHLYIIRASGSGVSMVDRWPKLAGRILVVNNWWQGRQAGSAIVDGLCGWWLGVRYLPQYTRRQGAGLK